MCQIILQLTLPYYFKTCTKISVFIQIEISDLYVCLLEIWKLHNMQHFTLNDNQLNKTYPNSFNLRQNSFRNAQNYFLKSYLKFSHELIFYQETLNFSQISFKKKHYFICSNELRKRVKIVFEILFCRNKILTVKQGTYTLTTKCWNTSPRNEIVLQYKKWHWFPNRNERLSFSHFLVTKLFNNKHVFDKIAI